MKGPLRGLDLAKPSPAGGRGRRAWIRRGPDQAWPGSGVARMRRSPDHGRVDRRRHAPAADLIFTGGPVYTADAARRGMARASPATGPGRDCSAAEPGGDGPPAKPGGDGAPADAVAVRDGRIVAGGRARQIRGSAGPA